MYTVYTNVLWRQSTDGANDSEGYTIVIIIRNEATKAGDKTSPPPDAHPQRMSHDVAARGTDLALWTGTLGINDYLRDTYCGICSIAHSTRLRLSSQEYLGFTVNHTVKYHYIKSC